MIHNDYQTEQMVTEAVNQYADLIRRICFVYLRNKADVEDVFQEVFLKLLQYQGTFESEAHKKNWLCRITINKCKDVLKSFWKKNVKSIDNYEIPIDDKTESELLRQVLALPPKYKDVIYLYYYEGYSVKEIAETLQQKENTVYSNLRRAREQLKEWLGGTENE